MLALADDLSGAAETAAALGRPRGRTVRIVLGPVTAPPLDGEAVVLDLDTRQLSAGEAASAVRDALAHADGDVVLKKIDSLLRGNLATETAAYAAGAAGVVIAPALPVAGRTVRDGVVHLHGTPLHATDAWRAEQRRAPESVGAALGDIPTRVVPLSVVRAPVLTLSGRLRTLVAKGHHPVCDAETDADLDAIAEAALHIGPDVRLLGTGGLAAALGRRLVGADGAAPAAAGLPTAADTERDAAAHGERDGIGHAERDAAAHTERDGAAHCERDGTAHTERDATGTPGRPLLVVVGTAEPTAVAQIAQLVAAGACHVPLPAHTLTQHTLTDHRARHTHMDHRAPHPLVPAPDGITVVSIAGGVVVDPGAARGLVAGLARTVAEAAHGSDLVLTGGETARRVLDTLGVRELLPVGQIHHGAVHSRTPDGRSVVTRPGSFGDTDSLLRIARALRPPPQPMDVAGSTRPDHPAVPPASFAPQGEPT
ncbi:four-carbon acid sugar kinase family protein [Streptomyces sporangiiformans]|uniref:Four-carbon acid sugar kinase family protein n=1 Tax=Streptomyces sporangiiformans TaxID=2315329 RepID=A0A505DEU6_9ACTN|nr:four-carbon acid sugar kinase family protein [Streptomyces sporangiiformans]